MSALPATSNAQTEHARDRGKAAVHPSQWTTKMLVRWVEAIERDGLMGRSAEPVTRAILAHKTTGKMILAANKAVLKAMGINKLRHLNELLDRIELYNLFFGRAGGPPPGTTAPQVVEAAKLWTLPEDKLAAAAVGEVVPERELLANIAPEPENIGPAVGPGDAAKEGRWAMIPDGRFSLVKEGTTSAAAAALSKLPGGVPGVSPRPTPGIDRVAESLPQPPSPPPPPSAVPPTASIPPVPPNGGALAPSRLPLPSPSLARTSENTLSRRIWFGAAGQVPT